MSTWRLLHADQWVELDGTGGTGLTDQRVTFYNDTYEPDYPDGQE